MDQKVLDYLKVAAEDAARSEERPFDIRVAAVYVPDLNGFMVISKSRYQRVLRRFQFRIQRNFHKTGYTLLYNGTEHRDFNLYDPNFTSALDLFGGIDPNYSVAALTIFGQFFSIRAFNTTKYHNPDFDAFDEDDHAVFPRKLASLHGGEIPNYPENKKGWNMFLKDLKQLYGKETSAANMPYETAEI